MADFADDLRVLADKDSPDLEANARERFVLIAYMSQIENSASELTHEQKEAFFALLFDKFLQSVGRKYRRS